MMLAKANPLDGKSKLPPKARAENTASLKAKIPKPLVEISASEVSNTEDPLKGLGPTARLHESLIKRSLDKSAGMHLIAGALKLHGAASVYRNDR